MRFYYWSKEVCYSIVYKQILEKEISSLEAERGNTVLPVPLVLYLGKKVLLVVVVVAALPAESCFPFYDSQLPQLQHSRRFVVDRIPVEKAAAIR